MDDISFQIPVAASASTNNLLLADETSDFLADTDMTLATPAVPTRTRLDNPLTLAELTPRSRPSRMPMRRSPRKHRATPAIASPLKQAVESSLSAAMEDTLSPLKRQDRSFQIPSMSHAAADLLLADDVEDLLRECGDATFEDAPAAAASPRAPAEALTLSQLMSPPTAPALGLPIRTLSPLEEHIPETSTLSVQGGNAGIHTNSLSPPRPSPSAFLNLRAAVQTVVDDTEQPSQSDFAPSLPFIPSDATDEHSSSINATVDKTDRDREDVPMDVTEPQPCSAAPAPAPSQRNPTKRASLVKPKKASTVTGGGIVKHSKTRPRTSSAARHSAGKTQRTKPLRSTRAASVVMDEASATTSSPQGPVESASSGFPDVNEAGTLAAVSRECEANSGENGFTSGLRISDTLVPSRASCPALPREHSADLVQASGTIDLATGEDHEPDRVSSLHDSLSESRTAARDSPEAEGALGSVAQERDNQTAQPAQNPAVPLHVVVSSETPSPSPAYPAVPPSPMRLPTKRSASAAENLLPEPEQRKRGRTGQSIAQSPRTRATQPKTGAALALKRSVRVLRSSRLKNASVASLLSRSSGNPSGPSSRRPKEPDALKDTGANSNSLAAASHKRTRGGAAEALAAVKLGSGHLTASTPFTLDGSASSSSSSNSHPAGKSGDTRSDISHDAGKPRHLPPAGTVRSMGQSEGGRSVRHLRRTARMPIPERLASSLPPAKPTRPLEFHFHSDARIEARKTDGGGSNSAAYARMPIPDFKAIHAAEELALAARRPPVAPTVPVEIAFETEHRAHERERFEEARRAREAEAERVLEEQRRLEAIEEERELKELRRRAVPKANEIPEWYAHAPKRSHDAKT